MTGKTHLAVGVGAGITIGITSALSGCNPTIAVLSAASCAIGSLMPDIDSRKSKAGKEMKITSFFVNKIFGHRGFVHSPLCLAIFTIPLIAGLKLTNYNEFIPLVFGFIAGYISHLVLDTMTKGGIPWLYPISKNKFSLCKIRSGSFLEILIAFVVLALFIAGYLGVWSLLNGH